MKNRVATAGGVFRHMTVLAAAGTLDFALMVSQAHAQTAAAVPPDATRVAQAQSTADESKDTALEDVIVTAERRSIDVQRIPASVSVRTGDELTEQGRYTTIQILQDIPGVIAVTNNSNNTGSADVQGNNITIRGITPAVSGAGGGPSPLSATPETAVYVDGVYEGIGSTYDLERVEVLRGPQGTLYGRSATAGVVAFHTRDPSLDSFGGNAEVEVGNYDLQHYSAAVNLPISNTLAVRVAGDYRDQGDGYFNEADRGKGSTTSGRAKVLWKPVDDFSLLVGVAFERDQAYSGGNQSTVDTANLGYTIATTSSDIFPGLKLQRESWAELNWDIGPGSSSPTSRHFAPGIRTTTGCRHPISLGAISPSSRQFRRLWTNFTPKSCVLRRRIPPWVGRLVLSTTVTSYIPPTTPSWRPRAMRYSPVMALTDDQKDTKDLGFFGETTFSPINSLRATIGVRYDSTRVETSEFFFNNPFAFCGTFAAMSPGFMLPPGVSCTGPGQANVPAPPGSSINNVAVTFHNFNYKARIEYDLAPQKHGVRHGLHRFQAGRCRHLQPGSPEPMHLIF